MKNIIVLVSVFLMMGCQNKKDGQEEQSESTKPVQEKTFVELGGEKQYVEMTGASDQLPVLLFLHGGPGWPQTPHLRYFNADLTKEMILVSWDQAGCGLSYQKNPTPKNLSIESLVSDAHELTLYLKKRFNKEKIVLLGFSYGSVIGLKLAEKYPEDYYAYLGVSQIIDTKENWDVSMQWLKDQAQKKQDTAVLNQLSLIEQRDTSVCKTKLDCFMSKYQLLVKYNGTIFNPEVAKEIEKAEQHVYDDYKDYDWYEAYNYTSSRLTSKVFDTDLTGIKSLEIPVFFMAGRHDWNLPGVVAERYLKSLKAPQKEYIWFEQSGHEPPEEEPDKFNKTIIKIVKEKSH
ncbi:pimeloyl-ACP methyl ester carboxylesterase [Nonlabens dokdonensis]|jgi:pimeloyl-ACP methyl ester carboxylesterase|uniref:Alpha/beta hydrolase n=2 Tax=Nonlabens dokdonensis TaxID=328515 RepID=L7WG96_NONDD|nr:alpha/beta hydrolase [Nonlabens dokdonensis]AGC77938.1 alpha/beta hydrolase [Nonlabens dokdonensis DSW-6]PZX36631.1 pimeloyl-ACP methyl ester carboxylesterase [Nonlabens dokdonensis]